VSISGVSNTRTVTDTHPFN